MAEFLLSPSTLPVPEEPQSLSKHFDVLTPSQFLDDFTHRAALAQRRIGLQAMYLFGDELGLRLEKVLMDGLSRGLEVIVCSDYFALMVPREHIRLPSLDPKARKFDLACIQATEDMFTRLKVAGVDIILSNRPNFLTKRFPALGRNHIKGAFVDDVAYIGGINYGKDCLNSSDFEVVIEDPDIVEALELPAPSVDRWGSDYITDLGETKILVDTGHPFRSIILRSAVEVVDQGEIVRFANPLAPDGPIRGAFYRGLRRIDEMDIISSNSSLFNIPIGNMALLADWMTRVHYGIREFVTGERLPIHHFPHPLHEKLLITDKKTMFGSHNFNHKGVWVGTQERSIQSSNPILLRNLNKHFDWLLSQSKPTNDRART